MTRSLCEHPHHHENPAGSYGAPCPACGGTWVMYGGPIARNARSRFTPEGLRAYRRRRGWDPPLPPTTVAEALATATDPVERRGLELALRRRDLAGGDHLGEPG